MGTVWLTLGIRGHRLLNSLWTEYRKSIESREACCKDKTYFNLAHGKKTFEVAYCHISKPALQKALLLHLWYKRNKQGYYYGTQNKWSVQVDLDIFNINCWVYSIQLDYVVIPWMKIRGEVVISDAKYKFSPTMADKWGTKNFCG